MWTHRVPQYNADRLEVLFCLTTHCLGPSRSRVSAERPFTLEWSRTSQEVTLMWCQWTRRGIIAAAIRMASPRKGNISCKRGILLCVFDWHVEMFCFKGPCFSCNVSFLLFLFQPNKPHRRKSLQSVCSHLKTTQKTKYPQIQLHPLQIQQTYSLSIYNL